MAISQKTYEDGVRDGRLNAHEKTLAKHSERLDSHSRRIGLLEKAAWIVLGSVIAIQLLPELRAVLKALSN